MTDKELSTILKQIKNERRGGAPHGVWVKRNRDILLMQVRNTTDVNAKPSRGEYVRHLFSIFFPTEGFVMAARALGVFLLVIGTVLGGGLVSAQVYSDATPGEVMYKVKLGFEAAQLFLAPNEEYKTRLHTDYADRRLDEAAKLAEGDASRQALVPGVLASFDAEVTALSNGLEALKSSDPDGVAEVAKLMERKMTVYQNVLRKASATLPADLQHAVAASRDLVDGVTIKAIAVLVEKHLAGSSDAPAAVVVNKFEERLKQAEAKLEAAPETHDASRLDRSSRAKAAIAAAKELLKEENYQAALTKIEEVAELTKEVEPEDTPPVTPDSSNVTPGQDPGSSTPPVTEGGEATSTKEEGTESADPPPPPATP